MAKTSYFLVNVDIPCIIIEEKELFRCPCPVRRKAEKKFDQKIRFPSAETPGFLLSE